jgi:hypothetical protein
MTQADEALNEASDFIAATLDKTDPRSWRRLLIYCPDWLVMERAKEIARRALEEGK